MAPATAIVRFAVWTILTLVTAIPMQGAPPSASIQVQDDHITVSGISPGGAVVIMCVGHEQHPYRQVMVRRDYYVLDDDHDGIATVALAKPLDDSVWCAIDVLTGRYAVSSKPGRPNRAMNLANRGLTRAAGKPARIDVAHSFLEVLWARPHVGVWGQSAGDGGAHDADGIVNGYVSFDAKTMRTIGGSPPPPDEPRPGDILVLVDLFTLEVYAAEVQP